MFKRIYVGNLSFQTPEDEIRKVFEQFGTVHSVSVIMNRETGRSKGFGFVEMDDVQAVNAIAGLNGTELRGRPMTVNEAKPMMHRDPGDRDYRGATNRHVRY
jgi:RNA recognition motif-containing protein